MRRGSASRKWPVPHPIHRAMPDLSSTIAPLSAACHRDYATVLSVLGVLANDAARSLEAREASGPRAARCLKRCEPYPLSVGTLRKRVRSKRPSFAPHASLAPREGNRVELDRVERGVGPGMAMLRVAHHAGDRAACRVPHEGQLWLVR
jgi:hypothetical protein